MDTVEKKKRGRPPKMEDPTEKRKRGRPTKAEEAAAPVKKVKRVSQTPREHAPDCRCPICQAKRGERVKGAAKKYSFLLQLSQELRQRVMDEADRLVTSMGEVVRRALELYFRSR